MWSSWVVLFQFHTQECTYINSHLVNWKLNLWHFKHAEALSGIKEPRFWFTQQFGLMIKNQDKTFTFQNALSTFIKLWIAVYKHQSTSWFGKTREHTPTPHHLIGLDMKSLTETVGTNRFPGGQLFLLQQTEPMGDTIFLWQGQHAALTIKSHIPWPLRTLRAHNHHWSAAALKIDWLVRAKMTTVYSVMNGMCGNTICSILTMQHT